MKKYCYVIPSKIPINHTHKSKAIKIPVNKNMNSTVIDYYTKRFGEDLPAAFIHLIREIGEIALAMEKNNASHAKLKISEASALLQYIAARYDLDLDQNIQSLYAHKLDKLDKKE